MKTKVKKIKSLMIEIHIGDKSAFFKKPDISICRKIYEAKNPIDQMQILLSECFLVGDKELVEDIDYFLPAAHVSTKWFFPEIDEQQTTNNEQ